MSAWIAFFRGINVGGKHSLAMRQLLAPFEAQGCISARSHIQSGNVVFEYSGSDIECLAENIAGPIPATHGFRPRIVILTADDLRCAAAANPYARAAKRLKTLHLYFLAVVPSTADLIP
jgi:uncharacterized protein (DUF1697 family)